MLADHRGIASLGLVMGIGVAACMVGGLTSLPALMKLWRSPAGKNPVTTMQ
jgi:predicted RND superfamily exporter protein